MDALNSLELALQEKSETENSNLRSQASRFYLLHSAFEFSHEIFSLLGYCGSYLNFESEV